MNDFEAKKKHINFLFLVSALAISSLKIKIFFILHAFTVRNRRSNRIALDILAESSSPAIEYRKTCRIYPQSAQNLPVRRWLQLRFLLRQGVATILNHTRLRTLRY